jgi:hypothetical protein
LEHLERVQQKFILLDFCIILHQSETPRKRAARARRLHTKPTQKSSCALLHTRRSAAMPTRPGTPDWVSRSRLSERLPPTPLVRRAHTPGRAEAGCLVTDPTPGLDSVYDNAHMMKSIAAATAPKGHNPYVQSQAYSSSFNSKVPNSAGPHRITLEKVRTPVLGSEGGLAYYSPYGSHAFSDASGLKSLSGSIYWASRGRLGPIGVPFEPLRRSPSFSSSVPRLSYTSKDPPRRRGINARDEAAQSFVLKSDHSMQANLRADFQANLHQQWSMLQPPMQRVRTAPGL